MTSAYTAAVDPYAWFPDLDVALCHYTDKSDARHPHVILMVPRACLKDTLKPAEARRWEVYASNSPRHNKAKIKELTLHVTEVLQGKRSQWPSKIRDILAQNRDREITHHYMLNDHMSRHSSLLSLENARALILKIAQQEQGATPRVTSKLNAVFAAKARNIFINPTPIFGGGTVAGILALMLTGSSVAIFASIVGTSLAIGVAAKMASQFKSQDFSGAWYSEETGSITLNQPDIREWRALCAIAELLSRTATPCAPTAAAYCPLHGAVFARSLATLVHLYGSQSLRHEYGKQVMSLPDMTGENFVNANPQIKIVTLPAKPVMDMAPGTQTLAEMGVGGSWLLSRLRP